MRGTDRSGIGRRARGILALAAALALWPALITADVAHAASAVPRVHEELRSARPGGGDTLAVAPRELRLTFVNPVTLSLAHLQLTGPDGTVALDSLRRADDAPNVLVAGIRGALVGGAYTVQWQVAGPDGHPVRGEYSFTIRVDAEGLAPPAGAAPVAGEAAETEAHPAGADSAGAHAPADAFPASEFGSGSPLYAAVRWLTFLGLLGAIGVVAFKLLVLAFLRRSKDPSGQAIVAAASTRAVRIGLAAVGLLIVALLLRLYAQGYALHGPAGALEADHLRDLLGGTVWGVGWWLQTAGTVAALVGLLLAGRGARSGWGLAAVGVVALGFSSALGGHAAGTGDLMPLAIAADGLHVLSAGGWLGSLMVVMVAGLPVALRRSESRGAAVAALINAFSPTALFFAGVVVATGLFSAWLHLGTVPALWTSAYGRTLLLKLGILSLLFATGAHNWLKVRPALGDPAAAGQLRLSAAFELVVGLLVLAVTAVLVATPLPMEP